MAKAGTLQLSMVPLSGLDPDTSPDSPHQPHSSSSTSKHHEASRSRDVDTISVPPGQDPTPTHQSVTRLAVRSNTSSPVRSRDAGVNAPARPVGVVGASTKGGAPTGTGSPGQRPNGHEVGGGRAGSVAIGALMQQASSELGKAAAERPHAAKRD